MDEAEEFVPETIATPSNKGETSKASKGWKGNLNGKLKAQLQATAKVSNKGAKSKGDKGANSEVPVRVASSQSVRSSESPNHEF